MNEFYDEEEFDSAEDAREYGKMDGNADARSGSMPTVPFDLLNPDAYEEAYITAYRNCLQEKN